MPTLLSRGLCLVRFFLAQLFLGCILMSNSAFAYEDDTHFWLTYYLARKAGFTSVQAAQIASADVSVDYDRDTQPATFHADNWTDRLHLSSNMQQIHAQFHAMPWKINIIKRVPGATFLKWDPTAIPAEWEAAAAAEVLTGKNSAWKTAWDDCKNPGIFLHYLQDSFSHKGFLSILGHQGYERVDFLATDLAAAHAMALSSLQHLVVFRERLGKCDPSPVRSAEEVDLNAKLGTGVVEEVLRVVDLIAAANPSPGRSESNLMLSWRDLTDKERRSDSVLPPRDMIQALIGRLEMGQVPDSYRARDIVGQQLALSPREMPAIWLYDYDSDGRINYETTREYFDYAPTHPANTIGMNNSRTERLNKLHYCPQPQVATMLSCMPYILLGVNVNAVPRCRVKGNKSDEPIGECEVKGYIEAGL